MNNFKIITQSDINNGLKRKRRVITYSVLSSAVLVVGMLAFSHHYLWWFTPAQAQRQTVQAFFNDTVNGKPAQAYALTDAAIQKNLNYSSFASDFGGLKGFKLAVNYKTFLVKNGRVAIVGTITDLSNNKSLGFGMNVASQADKNYIDTMTFVPIAQTKK